MDSLSKPRESILSPLKEKESKSKKKDHEQKHSGEKSSDEKKTPLYSKKEKRKVSSFERLSIPEIIKKLNQHKMYKENGLEFVYSGTEEDKIILKSKDSESVIKTFDKTSLALILRQLGLGEKNHTQGSLINVTG